MKKLITLFALLLCVITIISFFPSLAFAIGLPLSRSENTSFPENGICTEPAEEE